MSPPMDNPGEAKHEPLPVEPPITATSGAWPDTRAQ